MQNIQNSISIRGRLRSPGTINRYVATAKAVLGFAVRRDIVERNPVSQARFPRFQVRPRDRVLKNDEWQNLINAIREHKPLILPIIKFMTMVPCRTMELVGAKREQYDLASRTIYIPDSKARIPIYKPVPEELYNYFDSLPQDCPYLFYRESQSGVSYLPLTNLRYAWDFCCNEASISNYRIHDLRHLGGNQTHDGGEHRSGRCRCCGLDINCNV